MKLKIIYKSGASKLMVVPMEITVIELKVIITVDGDPVSKIEFL